MAGQCMVDGASRKEFEQEIITDRENPMNRTNGVALSNTIKIKNP